MGFSLASKRRNQFRSCNSWRGNRQSESFKDIATRVGGGLRHFGEKRNFLKRKRVKKNGSENGPDYPNHATDRTYVSICLISRKSLKQRRINPTGPSNSQRLSFPKSLGHATVRNSTALTLLYTLSPTLYLILYLNHMHDERMRERERERARA